MIFHFLAPPLISKPYQTTIISKRDDTVKLQCPATGNPQPTITWRKNRRAVVIDGEKYKQMDSGALEITSLERLDSGTYFCTASNPTGRDFLILTLHVYSEFDYQSAAIKISLIRVKFPPRRRNEAEGSSDSPLSERMREVEVGRIYTRRRLRRLKRQRRLRLV